jgi:c(7)-type cytochrome triheme protein
MPDMEKGKSCGACHDGKSAFTSSENCEKCHTVTKAVRYEIPGMVGNALFSHKVHLGRGYNCADCHKKLIPTGVERRPVTMKQMEEGKSCGSCHGFSMAFSVKDQNSCDRCHQRRFVPEK